MTTYPERALVLGVTGMVGNAMFQVLSENENFITFGTARKSMANNLPPPINKNRIIHDINVLDLDILLNVLNKVKPDVIINCTGVIKQLSVSNDPLYVLPINSIFPHRLSEICKVAGIRLIQFGTDCSYSGKKGLYIESDSSDAKDLYGKSKYIGEIHNEKHVITIRTSTIGHEIETKNGLIEWFLGQEGSVNGFRQAMFSGLPTVEIARVVSQYIFPASDMHGLYHLSASPISKYDLLLLVAKQYKKIIEIIPVDEPEIDRSLDSSRFTDKTGYVAPGWPELILAMHSYYNEGRS